MLPHCLCACRRVNGSLPDVVLLSSGSWYIVGDDHGYPPLNQSLASFQADMQQLRAAIDRANEQVRWGPDVYASAVLWRRWWERQWWGGLSC